MQIIYPRTKVEDVDAATEQLLNGRVQIYEETLFKELPVEKSKEALQKYQGRSDFCDKCDTIQSVGCIGGSVAFVVGYILLSVYATLGIIVGIGGLVSIFVSLGLKLLGSILYNLPDYLIGRDSITNLSWDDGDETDFSIFDRGWYYFSDKESYEKAKQYLEANKDIIESCDELFRLTQNLEKVGRNLRAIDKVRNFINDCGGKVDVTISHTDKGYQMRLKENNVESNSENGKLLIEGREFTLDFSKTEFKKITAKEDTLDFSYLDGCAEDCVKDIYVWSGKTTPMLEDKMPLLPDKLAQETAECEIVEI